MKEGEGVVGEGERVRDAGQEAEEEKRWHHPPVGGVQVPGPCVPVIRVDLDLAARRAEARQEGGAAWARLVVYRLSPAGASSSSPGWRTCTKTTSCTSDIKPDNVVVANPILDPKD